MYNEEQFLQEHYINMSRMILRYTIEKFLETNGKMFLRGEVLLSSSFDRNTGLAEKIAGCKEYL